MFEQARTDADPHPRHAPDRARFQSIPPPRGRPRQGRGFGPDCSTWNNRGDPHLKPPPAAHWAIGLLTASESDARTSDRRRRASVRQCRPEPGPLGSRLPHAAKRFFSLVTLVAKSSVQTESVVAAHPSLHLPGAGGRRAAPAPGLRYEVLKIGLGNSGDAPGLGQRGGTDPVELLSCFGRQTVEAIVREIFRQLE